MAYAAAPSFHLYSSFFQVFFFLSKKTVVVIFSLSYSLRVRALRLKRHAFRFGIIFEQIFRMPQSAASVTTPQNVAMLNSIRQTVRLRTALLKFYRNFRVNFKAQIATENAGRSETQALTRFLQFQERAAI